MSKDIKEDLRQIKRSEESTNDTLNSWIVDLSEESTNDTFDSWIVDLEDKEQPEACNIDDPDCENCGS